ncbi:hypothetical protein EJB05_38848, partial [Eragrostis curvula]
MAVSLQILALALVVTTTFTAHEAWAERDCHHEKVLVMYKCSVTLAVGTDYVDPSNKCRRAVESSDMVCVCGIIEVIDQLTISVAKLVRLARECGNPVPAGTKCGNVIVPPPLSPPSRRAVGVHNGARQG